MAGRISARELPHLAPHLQKAIADALAKQGAPIPPAIDPNRPPPAKQPHIKGSIFVMVCISLGILIIMMAFGLGHSGGHSLSHNGLIRY